MEAAIRSAAMPRPPQTGPADKLQSVARAAKKYECETKRQRAAYLELVMVIEEAAKAGASTRVIAKLAGISFQRVQQILAGLR